MSVNAHAQSEPAAAPEAAPAAAAAPEAAPAEAPPEPPTEVLVVGQRAEPSRSVALSREEVRELPGVFGDPFRAVEAMPGVTPIVSGLPYFFIRGAPPGNAGYYVDGVRVPLLFHVGAGPAVVHPGLIQHVDLYPGAYPARFGRYTGGIVEGVTAPPSLETHGEYNLRIFDAGALVETPLDEGRGSLLLAGRYSFTALLFSLLRADATLDYWDYQVRAGYDLTPKDRVSVFAFGSYDFLSQDSSTQKLTLFETQFHRVDLRYDHLLPHGNLRTAFTIGRDASTVQQNRNVHSTLTQARTELTQSLAPNVLLRAGTDLSMERFGIDLGPDDLSPSAQRVADVFSSRTDVALGARADVVVQLGPRVTLTPGVRADLFGSRGVSRWGVDPRLAVRAQVAPKWALLSAFGVVHQSPSFVVSVPGLQPNGLQEGLQRALQESFGTELNLGDGMLATATVFQNAYFEMTDPLGALEVPYNGCPPGLFPDQALTGDRATQPKGINYCGPRFGRGRLGPDRSGGSGDAADSSRGQRAADAFTVRTYGRAYGLELLFKRKLTKKLGGFMSYTLSRSTRSYGSRSYTATFDRTHVGNLALAYELGKGFRVGGRIVAYSGLPQRANGVASGRLPGFFRLDLRAEKKWRLGKTTWISAIAEWMNATLSKEAVATTCSLNGCEAQTIGPITIPSIGIEGGF